MDSRITKKDIIIVEGMDAFEQPGKRTRKTLAINNAQRATFYSNRPQLRDYLIEDKSNPPIEEGVYISQGNRQREGELFITVAGARVLMQRLVAQHQQNNHASSLNSKNCFLINDDTEELTRTLSAWNKRHDVDLKCTYINFHHHISLYLRKTCGKIKVFVLDSQPKRFIRNVIEAIRDAIPDAYIIRSTTPLQMDFFSCPVFTLRSMKYFVKHGELVFAHIDKCMLTTNSDLGCQDLNGQDLMPALLKMMQARMDLPRRVLDTVVSAKKNLTLGQYLDKYRIERDGKVYNACAMIKRYEYQSRLHSHLFKTQPVASHDEEAEKKHCCVML